MRSVLTRTQDIQWSGQRGEFRGKYKVGVTNGKVTGIDYMLYKNGGFNTDASPDILTCALVHIDNCYKFAYFHGTGKGRPTRPVAHYSGNMEPHQHLLLQRI